MLGFLLWIWYFARKVAHCSKFSAISKWSSFLLSRFVVSSDFRWIGSERPLFIKHWNSNYIFRLNVYLASYSHQARNSKTLSYNGEQYLQPFSNSWRRVAGNLIDRSSDSCLRKWEKEGIRSERRRNYWSCGRNRSPQAQEHLFIRYNKPSERKGLCSHCRQWRNLRGGRRLDISEEIWDPKRLVEGSEDDWNQY